MMLTLGRQHYRARSPAQCRCLKKSDQAEDRFEAHALGRSKGGLSTKVHAATDALGNPVRFILTGGERNDITQIEGLLEGLRSNYVLADKGYDSQEMLDAITAMNAVAVIPPKSNRKQQRTYDKEIYKSKNMVERTFNKLKHWRRLATRYDRKASYFLSSYISPQLLYGCKCRFNLG